MSPVSYCKKIVRSFFEKFGLDVRRVRPKSRLGSPKYSNFNEEEIVRDLVEALSVKRRFCVDIGAADGVSMSNSYTLFQSGWHGLAVEYDGDSFAKLAYRYSSLKGVNLARACVSPNNVLDLLSANDVPKDLGFLSLDIDGYDYFVLEKILSEYRPSIICVEVNTIIPPPVKFSVTWSQDYSWHGGHFAGQSIALVEELAKERGYEIVTLEFNNLFLVPSELNHHPALTAAEAYKKGYLDRPDRLEIHPLNKDMELLQTMPADKAVAYLEDYFKEYKGQFIIR